MLAIVNSCWAGPAPTTLCIAEACKQRCLGAAVDTLWMMQRTETTAERNRRTFCRAMITAAEDATISQGSLLLVWRGFRMVGRR
jgi:hypothetical protein